MGNSNMSLLSRIQYYKIFHEKIASVPRSILCVVIGFMGGRGQRGGFTGHVVRMDTEYTLYFYFFYFFYYFFLFILNKRLEKKNMHYIWYGKNTLLPWYSYALNMSRICCHWWIWSCNSYLAEHISYIITLIFCSSQICANTMGNKLWLIRSPMFSVHPGAGTASNVCMVCSNVYFKELSYTALFPDIFSPCVSFHSLPSVFVVPWQKKITYSRCY